MDMTWCDSEGAAQIQTIMSYVITLIKIVIPIGLIILGMLDLGKAVLSQKEDDIKKGQSTFIKRLVAAVVMFLIVFVVQIIIGFLVPKDDQNVWTCVEKFISGPGATKTPTTPTPGGSGSGVTGT